MVLFGSQNKYVSTETILHIDLCFSESAESHNWHTIAFGYQREILVCLGAESVRNSRRFALWQTTIAAGTVCGRRSTGLLFVYMHPINCNIRFCVENQRTSTCTQCFSDLPVSLFQLRRRHNHQLHTCHQCCRFSLRFVSLGDCKRCIFRAIKKPSGICANSNI